MHWCRSRLKSSTGDPVSEFTGPPQGDQTATALCRRYSGPVDFRVAAPCLRDAECLYLNRGGSPSVTASVNEDLPRVGLSPTMGKLDGTTPVAGCLFLPGEGSNPAPREVDTRRLGGWAYPFLAVDWLSPSVR